MKAYQIELAKKNGTINRIKSQMVDAKIRERYSISEQIAILRQKDEKPYEYSNFYQYAEMCKAEVQEYIDNPPSEFDDVKVLTMEEYEDMQKAYMKESEEE